MRKLKFMLLSLAIFAVVGGALAFKLKGPSSYCTAPLFQGACATTCPTLITGTTTNVEPTAFVCTTTWQTYTTDLGQGVIETTGCFTNIGNTTPALNCNVSTRIIKD